eukprot:8544964-Karenia_brevis.AAC.1
MVRQRDSLPCPRIFDSSCSGIGGVSRSVRRRLQKRHHVTGLANRAIESFNALAGYSADSDNFGRPSAIQADIQRRVLRACADMG